MSDDKPKIGKLGDFGCTAKIHTGCGNLYVTVNFKNGRPINTFMHLGKSGGCAKGMTEALSRLVALSFRKGATADEVVDELKDIQCPTPAIFDGVTTASCADAMAQAIRLAEAYMGANYEDRGANKEEVILVNDVAKEILAERG